MKILLVQDHLRGGGTERTTVFLADAFARAGHTVRLLTFRPGGVLAPAAGDRGCSVQTLQPFDLGLDWFAPGLVRAARDFAPDVVLPMGRMANCYAARLQHALPGAAVVATVRTGKPLSFAYRRGLRAARHVVANSEFARRTLVAPAGAGENCTVIPNAVLYSRLLQLAREPEEPPVILCVAQFRAEKRQRDVLAACAKLPAQARWRLVFVGDGPHRAECERRARLLGLAARTEFAGWQEEPAGFYARASIAVLTSERESLPNFLVEAQCTGVPVVTYDVGGAAECLLDGASGIVVPPGDVAGLARALGQLLADPANRVAMSYAARVFATGRFDPARQVEAYLDLFERLVRGG